MFEGESEIAGAIEEVQDLSTLDVLGSSSYITMKLCFLPVLDIHCLYVGVCPLFGSVIPVKTENIQRGATLPVGGLKRTGSYTTIGVGSRSGAQV